MAYRAAFVLPLLAVTLAAQNGTTPKSSEQDYPVRAKRTKLSIGLGHSFSSGREMFIAKNYLVVEVALFPAKGENLGVIDGHFSLRVNGRKQALSPQAPEFVAASLKYPDTDYGRQAVAALGPVVLGAPRPVERFPGDPNAQTSRLPQDDSSGIDAAAREAGGVGGSGGFARRRAPRAASGLLYFIYRGKLSHIRSLELVSRARRATPLCRRCDRAENPG